MSHLSSGGAQADRLEEAEYMNTEAEKLVTAFPKAALVLSMDANVQNPITAGGGDYGADFAKANHESSDGKAVLAALVGGSKLKLHTNPKGGCSVNKMRSVYTNQPALSTVSTWLGANHTLEIPFMARIRESGLFQPVLTPHPQKYINMRGK